MPIMIAFFLWLLDHVVRFVNTVNDLINNQFLMLKTSLFEGYYLKLAVYNRTDEKLQWIYNYDNVLYMLILWFDKQFTGGCYLYPYNQMHITSENSVLIGSYIKKGKQHYHFQNSEIKQEELTKSNFVYCVFANYYDLTKEFTLMKESLVSNNILSTKEIILMFSSFFDKGIKIENENEDVLKIVMDKTFEELTFKGKNILLLNNGGQ